MKIQDLEKATILRDMLLDARIKLQHLGRAKLAVVEFAESAGVVALVRISAAADGVNADLFREVHGVALRVARKKTSEIEEQLKALGVEVAS